MSKYAKRSNFDVVVALFCAFLLISNVAATKLIQFGPELSLGWFQVFPLVIDGGAFMFPLTYVLGDVLAEVYGFAAAKRAILLGFICSITASLVFLLTDLAPAAADWPNQAAWHAVLGFVPRIVLASLLAYLVGQFLNAWVLVKMRATFGHRSGHDGKQHWGQALWARLIGSSVVGEFADTMIFCLVAFVGVLSAPAMINYIAIGYLYKVLLEVLLLPITYRVIAYVKSKEPAEVLEAAHS